MITLGIIGVVAAMTLPNIVAKLPNGVCVGFNNYSANQSPLWQGARPVYIDINGEAPPNAAGSDLFMFILENNTIKPIGYDKDYEMLEYNCGRTNSRPDGYVNEAVGYYCAARVIADGWKIKYKY